MVQQSPNLVIFLYTLLPSISRFSCFLCDEPIPFSGDEMVQYALQRLYCVCFWSIAIQSNNLFRPSAGSDGVPYVLPWELSKYASFIFVGSAFISTRIFVLSSAVSVGSFIASWVVRVKLYCVFGAGIMDSFTSFLMLFGVVNISVDRPRVLGSKIVSKALEMRADAVICSCGKSTKTWWAFWNCSIPWTFLSKLRLQRAWAVDVLSSHA